MSSPVPPDVPAERQRPAARARLQRRTRDEAAWPRRKPKMRDTAQPQPRSLRLRLALWYGALLAAALLLFGVLVTVLTSNAILQSVDSALGAEARVATLDLDRVLLPAPPYWPTTLNLNVVDAYRDPGVTVAIFDAQGSARYRSAAGTSLPLVGTGSPAFGAALTGRTTVLSSSANGEPVRVVVMPVHAPVAQGEPVASAGSGAASTAQGSVIGVLLVAKSLRDVSNTLLLLRTVLIVTGLAILAAALLGGWGIALRVLRPLALIAATARRIATSTSSGATAGPLRHRVPRPAGEDELAHLVDTLNDMLAALEHATAVQRRFVADASHELRAPLTTIQGNLAFLQRHANDLPPDERQVMLADAHGETLRLARLVDDLLLLARADASSDGTTANGIAATSEAGSGGGGILPASTTLLASGGKAATHHDRVIELDRIVLHLVRQLRGRLAADAPSRLRLEVGHIEPVRVRGDEEALRRVALILLDNAMKYTLAKGVEVAEGTDKKTGRVTVIVERVGAEAVLRVQDTGIGIEAVDLPHIYERFYRADTARRRGEGTGLGLPIARALVERLHGRIAVESVPGQGSTFSIWLPAADSASASAESANSAES